MSSYSNGDSGEGNPGRKELNWESVPSPAPGSPWQGPRSTFSPFPSVPPRETLPFHSPCNTTISNSSEMLFFSKQRHVFTALTSSTGKERLQLNCTLVAKAMGTSR